MSDSTVGSAILPAGTPCWIELAATDDTAARAFYGELFGWEFAVNATRAREPPIQHRDPRRLADRRSVPGRPEPATGWIPHLAVTNAAATAEWTEHLGGLVTLGPVDIPDRGTVVHAIDPSGAPVVFWQLAPSWTFARLLPGTYNGIDLNTHDAARADDFYDKLFGYTSHQVGADGIDYLEWRINAEPVIYRYVLPDDQRHIHPYWTVYLQVDPYRGTDAAAGHALMLGGRVLTPPFDSPFGRVAVLADPGGAVFSIVDPSRPVDLGTGRAEVDDPYDD
nr:VOC family protein [Saccharomonospora sp. CUA-673]